MAEERYKILSGRNASVLSKLVNEHLEQGYGLAGSPYFGMDLHCQAVIKPINGVNWDFIHKIHKQENDPQGYVS